MLSALEAVAPTTTVVDTFRERGTLSNLGSIDARIEKDEAKLDAASATIDADKIAKAKAKYGTTINEAEDLITETGEKVKKSNDLTGQEFDPVRNVNVSQISIDKQQKIDVMNKEYGNVSTAIASNAPAITDASGKILTPTIEAYTAHSTEYDRQLTTAQMDGNNEEVIRLINEKQQLELGSSGVVDAATQKFENKVK